MRHKVRDLGVFFCLAVMLFTVTSCGKEVSDQTIAATEQSSEESRAAETVMRTETAEAFSTEKAGGGGMPDDLVYAAVIHVKINPEFNLYLDSEGCIVYVEYLNEDAADLFETVDLTGQKLADGMETIVGAAEEKGYLTGQNEVCLGAGKIVCELCGGSHGKPCSICHGKGVITDDCILCHGAKKCTVCGGSGKM